MSLSERKSRSKTPNFNPESPSWKILSSYDSKALSPFDRSPSFEKHDEDTRSSKRSNSRERRRKSRSRSSDRNRSRRYSRDRDNDRYSKRHDYSSDRYRRDHDRYRYRSRSRDKYRKRSSSRERVKSDYYNHRSYRTDDSSHKLNYKNQTPTKTIVMYGIPPFLTDEHVLEDIKNSGFYPTRVKVIGKGSSTRGFAFVEFSSVSDSVLWMETTQGEMLLQGQYKATLQYRTLNQHGDNDKNDDENLDDWFCTKCGVHNFKRRRKCFRCQTSKIDGENDEISNYVTKTIMLSNLDALTIEETILNELKTHLDDALMKKINGVLIGRDRLTNTSRGICYLDVETTAESLSILTKLKAINPPLVIDNKEVKINYCKYKMGDVNEKYPHEMAFKKSSPQTYTLNDLSMLANYSASRYAKTPEQYQYYYDYYTKYFSQQIQQGVTISLSNSDSQMDEVNAAAAVAQSAMQQRQKKLTTGPKSMAIPNGTDNIKYSIPDISSYVYDKTTGFYYDSSTGLYYEPNSQYYYNSIIQKYLYWDSINFTYKLAPNQTAQGTLNPTLDQDVKNSKEEAAKKDDEKKSSEKTLNKKEKTKRAQKLAKDMERWAKSMNRSKELTSSIVNSVIPAESPTIPILQQKSTQHTFSAADICFAVLEKKAALQTSSALSSQTKSILKQTQTPSQETSLVASYGGTSDNSGGEEDSGLVEGLDWDNLICLLCRRKFQAKDQLLKHQQMSDLHKTNLEQYRIENSLKKGETIKYRDRAKERRDKFGSAIETPAPSKLKEKYLEAMEAIADMPSTSSSTPAIGAENKGNRLLQKMGWSEGQGLGRSNQGRTTIIEAGRNVSTAGLGSSSNKYQELPGESYKDKVKKMMYARYQEIKD